MKTSNLYQIVQIFFILILLQSCVSENREIVRGENGNIILKCELKNGVKHGKCYEYYPNGTTWIISNWIDGVRDGETIVYFENGKIKETSMWKDDKLEGESLEYTDKGYIFRVSHFIEGKPQGLWIQYYQGIPMRSIQYVVAKDYDDYVNQFWEYDYFGDVKKEKSHFYTIYSERDSIKVGETGEIKVKLDAPYFVGGHMKIVTGDFDGKYNPKERAKLDTINCVGYEGTVKFKFDEKGTQFIEGIILDCVEKEEGYNEEGRKYGTNSVREIFFRRSIEVY